MLLGPELSVSPTGVTYKKHFKEVIEPRLPNLQYIPQDNLFLVEDVFEDALIGMLQDFYSHAGDPVLMEMLSRIRFPLIINVAPDTALNNLYDKLEIEYEPGYFLKDTRDDRMDNIKPSKDKPVIYNIFGTVDVNESLIYTHSRLYQTIDSLLQKNALPNGVQRAINAAASFLFLGFKFDSWYYQLICYKLGVKRSVCTPGSAEDDHVSIVMNKNFKMSFTSRNLQDCVQVLLEECKLSLRKASPVSHYSTFISYAHQNLDDPDLDRVVDLIEQKFPEEPSAIFKLFRDHNDLNFGDSIDSFMHMIGMGKSVVLVISDKYLRSEYCMTEALRVANYHDDKKRVFYLVLSNDNQDLFEQLKNPEGVRIYRDHWFNECQGALNDPALAASGRLERLVAIYQYIDVFVTNILLKKNLLLDVRDIYFDSEVGQYEVVTNRKAVFNDFIQLVLDKLKE